MVCFFSFALKNHFSCMIQEAAVVMAVFQCLSCMVDLFLSFTVKLTVNYRIVFNMNAMQCGNILVLYSFLFLDVF